jgi:putative tricarboxylic transport membrane protein
MAKIVRNSQDFWGGAALFCVAAVAYWAARPLAGIEGNSFGSGTTPRLFAAGLGVLSLAIVVRSLVRDGPVLERYSWRGPVFITAAIFLFAATIRGGAMAGIALPQLGLALAGSLSAIVASFAISDARPREVFVFSVLLTFGCILVFSYALKQPIPVWPRLG